MEKNGKRLITASAIITLILIGVGIVRSYTFTEAKAEQSEKAMANLKEEGCMPAREADKDIAVILEGQIRQDRKLEKLDDKLDEILRYLRKSP